MSLVEVLVSATLTTVIMAGIMSLFLLIGRSGVNVGNYADMEVQARGALERFGQDTRQASGLRWNSPTSITLILPASVEVTYSYDSAAGTFSRASGGATTVLVAGVTDEFSFTGYMINGGKVTSDLTTAGGRTAANGVTKQLQIYFKARRSHTTVANATNTVLSARFILRNKRVTA